MASNLDKTNELLDFMHAKVHSFYRSSVLLWFLHEIICSSLKGKLFASPFFAIYFIIWRAVCFKIICKGIV